MVWQDFLVAIGLLLVFEGILPFLSPNRWRQIALNMVSQHDATLRFIGFVCMIVGAVIVVIMHRYFF
jgi:hypothetical protein